MKRYPQPRRFLENMPLPARIRKALEPERSWQRRSAATTDRLRVAIVTESFLPHVNGVTNSVLRVLEHLKAEAHEAVVICAGKSDDQPSDYLGFPIDRVPSIPMPGYRQVRIGLTTRRRVVDELEAFQPDVVHLASPFVLGAVAARAAQHMGVPVVSIYQTDVAGFASGYGLRLASDAMWAHIVRIHERCDFTLAPSRPSLQDLAGHDIPRVELWPRGVDSQRFHPDKASASLRSLIAPNGEVIVGYVGRLAREKQIDALVALVGMPNVRLVVVGEGPYRPELERMLPQAEFLGFLAGEELATAVASLDVMVHTGEHETFCQSVQEALASGVPVVAPASGGPLDLVHSGLSGFLYEPGNPSDLANKVNVLVQDSAMRKQFSAAARESVEHRSWHAVCEQLMDFYRRAIDAHAAKVA